MIQSAREHLVWRAVPIAGIAGGLAYLITQMVLSATVLEVGATLILSYTAGLVLGTGVLLQSTPLVWIVGILIHFALSIFFALIIAIVVHRWGLLVGIIGGGLIGLAIYAINFYTMTLFFDWFFALNGWVLALSHVIFGMVAGGVYEALDNYDLPLETEVAA